MRIALPAGRLLLAAAVCIGAGVLAQAKPAQAEIVQLAGPGFVQHCPCAVDATDPTEVNNGTTDIIKQNSRLFASVPFPKDGEKVCSVSLIYRDVNGNDSIRARLFKKAFTVGGNAYAAPIPMATVTSAPGVVNTVRKATTTTISQNVIAKGSAFYYVLVDAPTINLAFLGVQIDVRPSC